jgi:hypothetical protein
MKIQWLKEINLKPVVPVTDIRHNRENPLIRPFPILKESHRDTFKSRTKRVYIIGESLSCCFLNEPAKLDWLNQKRKDSTTCVAKMPHYII